jgi:hypothetical protein
MGQGLGWHFAGAAIHSNFAIQSRRLRRQESQLKRLKRYERVADQLITARGELDGWHWHRVGERAFAIQIQRMNGPISTGNTVASCEMREALKGEEKRRSLAENRKDDF